MEKANKEEQKAPQNLNEKTEVLFCSALSNFHFTPQISTRGKTPYRCFYKQMHSQLYLANIFHPPPVA